MSCKICKSITTEDKAAVYDLCKCLVCPKCTKLNATELRVVTLKGGRKLKYYCEICEGNYISVNNCDVKEEIDIKHMLRELLKTVKEQSVKIAEMEEVLKKLEKSGATKNKDIYTNQLPTTSKIFANVVKEPAIIIKPVEEQESYKTIEDIENHIDPTELAVGINKMKSIRNGGVVISCTDQKSVETVKKKVMEELGETYTVDMTQLKNPRAIIVGVEEKVVNMEGEDVLSILIKQNEALKGEKKTMKIIRNM